MQMNLLPSQISSISPQINCYTGWMAHVFMHILIVSGSMGNDNIVTMIGREGNVCIRSLIICIPRVLIHIVAICVSTENDNFVAVNSHVIFVSYH